MPLVRYLLSDRTRWKPGRCACARAFPMIEEVAGKYEDRITGSNGAAVSASVLTFAFKGLDNIRRSQVAQVGQAHWEIRLVPEAGFGDAERRRLVDNIHRLVDPGVKVDVVLKDELSGTAAGKFRWVVNET
jgi:phenylacetate-CoA ligase